MRPFELVIPGRPISRQVRSKQGKARLSAWAATVNHLAREAWMADQARAEGAVSVQILFFLESGSGLIDIDNVVKTLLDELKGVAYDDDRIISDLSVHRRSLGTTFLLKTSSPILASGLALGSEFVYIRVEDAGDQDELP